MPLFYRMTQAAQIHGIIYRVSGLPLYNEKEIILSGLNTTLK